jgi:hypothetical protein
VISEYFFTPKDLFGAIRDRGSKRGAFGFVLLACAMFFLWMTSTLSFEGIALLLYVAAVIYWKLDARISFALAFASLVTIVVLLVLYNLGAVAAGNAAAEKIATWAYWFMLIGACSSIITVLRGREIALTGESGFLREGGTFLEFPAGQYRGGARAHKRFKMSKFPKRRTMGL